MMNTRLVCARLTALALGICGGTTLAGDLNPPAGPVAPTMKKLSEVEPRIAINATNTPGDADSLFKITQPGSYYLMGNVQGVAGKIGVEIASSGVTIDLDGFELLGVPGSLSGVTVTQGLQVTNLCVKNGSIRNWGQNGVRLYGNTHSQVLNLCSTGNGATGISISDGQVSHCDSSQNFDGIWTDEGATVFACSANGNADHGVYSYGGSTITQCTTDDNARGIVVALGGAVIDCTARNNSQLGIEGFVSCSITGCTVNASGGDGIYVDSQCVVMNNNCALAGQAAFGGAGIHVTGTRNRIEGNHCTLSLRGIDVDGTANVIMRNTCSGNTTNWTIVAFNAVAQIVAVSGNAAAINGNSYSGSLGSTDPNANFTH